MLNRIVMASSLLVLAFGCTQNNESDEAETSSWGFLNPVSYKMTCKEIVGADLDRPARFAVLEIRGRSARHGKITMGVGEAVSLSRRAAVDHVGYAWLPVDEYKVNLGSGASIDFYMHEETGTAQAYYNERDKKAILFDCTVEKKKGHFGG